MTPKVINALSARIARLETLLENNDTFGPAAPVADSGLNYQGSQFGGITFGDNYFQTQEQGQSQPDRLDQQLEDNYGFGPTEATINDLMNRIAELELMVANGSRDTQQSGALDAGQSVGDDGSAGAGSVTGGLGTMSTQNATAVAITGGNIAGITDLAVADGGTGASTAAAARTNLGLGTIATQASSNVSITGGSLSNVGISSITSNVLVTGTIDSQQIVATAPSAADADMITAKDSGGDAQVVLKTTTLGGRVDIQSSTGTQRIVLKYDSGTGYSYFNSDNANGLQIVSSADLALTGNKIAFFTGTPQTIQTVTGSRGANAALASLLTKLASYGLIIDSST